MRVSDVDTGGGPPVRLPITHVVVGFGFLVVGVVAGVLALVGRLDGLARLAPVHLLLVGWVCVTIMGAMEQFVPVWSGVELHSRRLADAALGLVAAGVVGLAWAAVAGRPRLLALGLAAVVGVWLFVYDLLRTLPVGDVTERHFAYALCALTVAVGLGGLLAVDVSAGLLSRLGVAHGPLRAIHATLAVVGGIGLTVVGALVQLGPMFAGTGSLDSFARRCCRIEEATLPAGVALLAVGRGTAVHAVAAVGGGLVAVGVLVAGGVLLRTVLSGRTESTPTARRYAVTAAALLLWAVLAGPALVTRPLGTGIVGPPPAAWLFGVALASVLVGTLYHVVPFLVWDHRYADRLGYEPVPTVDDLYDGRLARVDLFALCLGGGTLVVSATVGVEAGVVAGAVVASAALVLAALNLALPVRRLLWDETRTTSDPPPAEE
jgi:hypothetical protein